MNASDPGPQGVRQDDDGWRAAFLTVYDGFEQLVALVLSALIAVVIVVALIQLVLGILPLVVGGALDVLDHGVFQALFGTIITILIAIEFGHSIVRVALRHERLVQVKTVVLIALLALARKFIVLDTLAVDAATMAALALATLVLGAVYWLLRERDDRGKAATARAG
ncbi:MAG TPA: phosphate-starvation-inducible PsiE family protein [Usitatibacter sp.]|jgi:uncharacterized membrane protein (DUF373 family)|nr:phosphate-starvation-inducible PsiE family protein [Usitatibacter sp.]